MSHLNLISYASSGRFKQLSALQAYTGVRISLDCRHLQDSILHFVLHAHDTISIQEIGTEGTIAFKVLERGVGILKIIEGAKLMVWDHPRDELLWVPRRRRRWVKVWRVCIPSKS